MRPPRRCHEVPRRTGRPRGRVTRGGPRGTHRFVGPNGPPFCACWQRGGARPRRGGPRSYDPDRRPSAAGGGGAPRGDAARAPRASNRSRCRRARAQRRPPPSTVDDARVDSTQALSDRYDQAPSRFMAIGGATDARGASVCAGAWARNCARPAGSRRCRAARRRGRRLPRCFAQADLLFLDEPTNDSMPTALRG